MIKSFLEKNIQEISASRSLQLFGIILGVTHLLTAFFWIKFNFGDSFICWPFLSNCQLWGTVFRDHWYLALSIYSAFSVASIVFFFLSKTRLAFWAFLIATALKVIFHLLDYRMMGNYHYMSHVINFLVLFASYKKDVIRLFIVLFYVSAGMIKFNSDWLSGSALVSVPIISGKLLEWACAYVIVLELVVSLFLLTKNKLWKNLALLQFGLFHIFSWHIVGYFYPLIMFSLLTAFLFFREDFRLPTSRIYLGLVAIFCVLQLYPLVVEKNSSLNGRGRILSLNMLDAKSICETHFFIRHEKQIVEYQPNFSHMGIRIHCDPIVVVDRAQKICAEQSKTEGFEDIDLDHQIRRISDSSQTEQMTFKNICSKPLRVGILGHVRQ